MIHGTTLPNAKKRAHNQADRSADRNIFEPEHPSIPLLRQENAKQRNSE